MNYFNVLTVVTTASLLTYGVQASEQHFECKKDISGSTAVFDVTLTTKSAEVLNFAGSYYNRQYSVVYGVLRSGATNLPLPVFAMPCVRDSWAEHEGRELIECYDGGNEQRNSVLFTYARSKSKTKSSYLTISSPRETEKYRCEEIQ